MTVPPFRSRRLSRGGSDLPLDTLALGIARRLGLPGIPAPRPDARPDPMPCDGKVLVVSSARAGEGKSFIVGRLARRLRAIVGATIVVVDAHARHPSVHASFRVAPDGRGLFDALAADGLVVGAMSPSVVPGVDAWPCGPGADPLALARAGAVARVLRTLRERYPLVIIDAPPLPRTGSLTTLADATLLVIDAGRTSRDAVRATLDAPHVARDRMLGVALNRVPSYACIGLDDP